MIQKHIESRNNLFNIFLKNLLRRKGGENKKMSKDQTIGALILLVCVLVALAYVIGLFLYPTLIQPWLNVGTNETVQFWLVATPVLIGFVAILAIGAWIGWTMATTPPPKPIEDVTAEEKPAEAEKTTPQMKEAPAQP
jgi:predicted DNA-binding transcriptional regulator